ncbi:MAG: phosphoglycerate dehydrogenase, partial [Actinobacteria bacterium]|nr:phosphoglycerate dehydrogenase [Actinomycetota bacterium]
MARILVTESIAPGGLDRLRAAGHDVDVQEGLSDEELKSAIAGAHALIIRSATQVTADVLAKADSLIAVGRAGIGLDNVDVTAATESGVMVINAPQSNIISAAEHTMALLLSQARNVPQAHSALVDGRWERSKWEGVELADKTLGIVGLGRIGKLVADRARAFQMRIVAFDPFVSEDRAKEIGVELLSLEELVAASDFLTVHLPRTPETIGLINAGLLATAKPSLRVINVARGGIVVEEDLAGAALDVFDSEPCTDSPLFGLPQVVVTPHLGASTR